MKDGDANDDKRRRVEFCQLKNMQQTYTMTMLGSWGGGGGPVVYPTSLLVSHASGYAIGAPLL